MNNFNDVFLAIKRNCNDKGEIKGKDYFEKIAKESNMPDIKLEFILTTLQHLELIKYSMTDYYIKLTLFGKKHERLFTDTPSHT